MHASLTSTRIGQLRELLLKRDDLDEVHVGGLRMQRIGGLNVVGDHISGFQCVVFQKQQVLARHLGAAGISK